MHSINSQNFRRSVLERFDATGSEIDELLEYNTNVFDHSALKSGLSVPFDDVPFVPFWEKYAEEARHIGVFEALKKRLVQFNFPIQEGVSETEDYKNAVRKGLLSENVKQNRGLELKNPEKLALLIHQTPAGKIPIIVAHGREDFVSLLQALTLKNEPRPVPDSQGAAMIAGYNNWDRIWKLKEQMNQEKGTYYVNTFWSQEFKNIVPRRHLYQDKFILLSRDYYSGVTPMTTYDPQATIYQSPVFPFTEDFLNRVRRKVLTYLSQFPRRQIDLFVSGLDAEDEIIGAAAVALSWGRFSFTITAQNEQS